MVDTNPGHSVCGFLGSISLTIHVYLYIYIHVYNANRALLAYVNVCSLEKMELGRLTRMCTRIVLIVYCYARNPRHLKYLCNRY